MKQIDHRDTTEMLDFQVSHNSSRIKKTDAKHRSKARMRHIRIIGKHVPDAKTILCLGCRSKRELDDFRDAGLETTGVDILPSEHYMVMDIHNIGDCLDQNQFDFIYASHVLEHLYDPEKVLSSIRNISKFGVFIVLPTCHSGVKNSEKKNTPSMSHPAIYDIMRNGRESFDEVTEEDLRDFNMLEPYVLKHYKLIKRSKGHIDECEIVFRWR